MIYLDHNATTQPAPEVLVEMHDALVRAWANPSSTHAPGQAARRLLADARLLAGDVAPFLQDGQAHLPHLVREIKGQAQGSGQGEGRGEAQLGKTGHNNSRKKKEVFKHGRATCGAPGRRGRSTGV